MFDLFEGMHATVALVAIQVGEGGGLECCRIPAQPCFSCCCGLKFLEDTICF